MMMLPTFLIANGLALASASINLFFRDLEHFINLIIMALFYLTPIFYDIKFVPEKYRPLIFLNPFTPIIANWRRLFMHNTLDIHDFILSLCYAVIIQGVGYLIYRKLKRRFAEVL